VASDRQQAPEEGAVALQRDPQILGRDVVAAVPLGLQAAAFLGEHLRQPLHGLGDELVGVLDGPAGFVDEPRLDRIPRTAKRRRLRLGKEALGRGVIAAKRAALARRGTRRCGVGELFGRQGRRLFGRQRLVGFAHVGRPQA